MGLVEDRAVATRYGGTHFRRRHDLQLSWGLSRRLEDGGCGFMDEVSVDGVSSRAGSSAGGMAFDMYFHGQRNGVNSYVDVSVGVCLRTLTHVICGRGLKFGGGVGRGIMAAVERAGLPRRTSHPLEHSDHH